MARGTSKIDIDRRFGRLVREAREHEGLSVRELARRSGIDPTYISRVERGLVGPPKWPKIAAMVRQMPSSPLARVFEAWGGEQVRSMVLQSAKQTLELLLALPRGNLEDGAWGARVRHILKSCIAIIETGAR